MASFKHLTFLKVLAVIAWADGEMTESEKNILKEFIARGTYIYPPQPSMRIITDIFAYAKREGRGVLWINTFE